MINGVLYATVGSRRDAVAIDAATGELLWMFRIDEGKRAAAAPRLLSGRGVAYWTDGKGDERIFMVTFGYQLVALDAKTGIPVREFGQNGILDLKQNNDQVLDPITGEIGLNTGPIVAKDVVIVGAAHRGGAAPRSRTNAKGYIRGFDVKTGKRLWIFHTIPQPGEFGNETWENDSWSYSGNTGMWGPFSVDEELETVYMPIELSTGDYYGGHRPGNNLFTESLVAVDLYTGKRKWHFQLVHHGIWDFDLPCAPILADVTIDGKPRKIAAVPSKQGFLYVFDRQTGQPVWPIVEKPVEKGTVPGEWYSPTQPFPTKPPPFELQGVQEKDLIDFTPELLAEAKKVASNIKLGPLFTPPIPRGRRRKDRDGVHRERRELARRLIRSGNRNPVCVLEYADAPAHPRERSQAVGHGFHQHRRGRRHRRRGRRRPRLQPDAVRDHGPGAAVCQTAMGPHHRHRSQDGRNGVAGAARRDPRHRDQPPDAERRHDSADRPDRSDRNPDDEDADRLGGERIHDAAVGSAVREAVRVRQGDGTGSGKSAMPAPQTGNPMSYMLNGKQYIVLAISGPDYPAELIAYTAP